MNQRKKNSSRWYVLGLAVILTAGCMLMSVGTAFARYRLDDEREIHFTNREPVSVALGTVEKDETTEDEIFVPDTPLEWKEIWLTDGSTNAAALDFAISNYLGENDYDSADIQVQVRLIGSLDAWNSAAGGTMSLTDGTLLEDGTPRLVTATVTPIPENTALYHDFGMGWIFAFLDENGQELSWTLEGGDLAWMQMRITMDASVFQGTSLMQLQVSGMRTE